METSVASLLLITSAVIIGCLVITYAVSVVEQTLNMENFPQIDRIIELRKSILNQTESLLSNQTIPDLPLSP